MPIYIIWGLIVGAIAAAIASGKGKNPFVWFLLSFVFGGIPLVILFFMPDERKKEEEQVIASTKECPGCSERVKKDAKICRFCSHEFPENEITHALPEGANATSKNTQMLKDMENEIIITDEEVLQRLDSVDTSLDNVSIADETKKCHSCAETIKYEAAKCRFCGESFDVDELNNLITEKKKKLLHAFKSKKENEIKEAILSERLSKNPVYTRIVNRECLYCGGGLSMTSDDNYCSPIHEQSYSKKGPINL